MRTALDALVTAVWSSTSLNEASSLGLTIAFVLGALQGVTEFLPISSSGHLRLLAEVSGIREPQTFFDILLHVGTLLAVLIVYRRQVLEMLLGLGRVAGGGRPIADNLRAEPMARVALLAALATLPTALIAIAFGSVLEAWAADITHVGIALMLNGGLLLFFGIIQRRAITSSEGEASRPLESITWKDALVIGVFQGAAITRGISRSGSTILAGVYTGLDREAAATFSFIISIPAILGALVLKFESNAFHGDGLWIALAGGLTAAVVGTLALLLLLKIVRKGALQHFAWYCFLVGIGAISWGLWG